MMAGSSIALLCVIAATIFVAVSAQSPLETVEQRQFNELGGDVDIPELNAQGCGQDRHCIFVKNGCNEYIWVAAHYEPMGKPWVIDGWWRIPANSKKFIINNAKNAAIFFHAQNAACTIVWGDPKNKWGWRGGLYTFGKEIMPDNVLYYTMVFDCNGAKATMVKGPPVTPVV